MNISIKSLLVIAGIFAVAQVQAYTYKFINHTHEELNVHMLLGGGIGEKEEVFMVPSGSQATRTFSGLRIGLCPAYIGLENMSGNVVFPRLVQASPEKYEMLMRRVNKGEAIDFDVLGSQFMITQGVGRCGDMLLDIITDDRGQLFFVMINPVFGPLIR
jgi:hypothetical protein